MVVLQGVIEGCRSAFISFCTALFQAEDEDLLRIPGHVLNEVSSHLLSV